MILLRPVTLNNQLSTTKLLRMAENPPQIIVLKDLESIARDFVCARPFRFSLKDIPDKVFVIQIKPLTQALLAQAREFTQISPPRHRVQRPKPGPPPPSGQSAEMEEVEEDNFGDPEFLRSLNEKSVLRRAFVLCHGLPEIKFSTEFSTENLPAIAKEIAEKFPDNYSIAVENEILRQSTNELAIINLANFSASDDSAQS